MPTTILRPRTKADAPRALRPLPHYSGKPLLYAFTCAFLLLLTYLLFAAFLWNNCDLVAYSTPLTLICFAVAGGAAFLLYRLFAVLCGTRFAAHRTLWVALFFVLLLLPQAVVAHAVYYQPGWDVSILTEGGYWLGLNKGMVDPAYFRQYPNNVPLLMVWAYVTKLVFALGGTDFLFYEIMLCAACINAAVFLVYLLAQRHCGAPLALTAAALCVPLLCFAPWIVIPYSDTATILFPILAFWLWTMGGDAVTLRARLLWYAGAGLCVGAGFSLKPTVFIVCIAFALADLLCYAPHRRASGGAARAVSASGGATTPNAVNPSDTTATSAVTTAQTPATPLRSRLLCLGALFAVVFLCMGASTYFCNRILHASGVTDAELEMYTFPATHFFNMGLSESISPVSGGTVYGKWHGDDVLTAGNALTRADKIDATLTAAGDKLTAMGALGYVSYLNKKVRWFMGDGTFYFGGESPIYDCFQQEPFAKGLQQFWWRGGQYYWLTAHVLQGLWMLCIFLCALPVIWRRDNYGARHLAALRLCVCGIMLFIALFEGRSRYLTNFLPLFALLAAVSIAPILGCAPKQNAEEPHA